jgi:hypothetical protein
MTPLAAVLLTLSTTQLSVTLDRENGSLVAIENRLTGDRKELSDNPFALTTSAGVFEARICRLTKSTGAGREAEFRFACGPLEVTLRYKAERPDAGAVRKFLRIANRGGEAVTIFRVGLFDWTIPAAFPSGYPHSYYPGGIQQIHFHRSGIWYDQSISLFLRDDTGGLFVGVENPYFEAGYRALRKVYPSTVDVAYRPNWILKPGETFDSDPGFAGVYRQEHIYAVAPLREYFAGRERIPFEVLDWGEVWAMQAYMRSIMPLHESPGGAYYMSYWGLADPAALGRIQRKKDSGEALTAEEAAMWKHFGGGPFPLRKDELWYRLTPETLRFYRKAVDDAAWLGGFQTLVVPNMLAGHAGWFASPEEKADSFPASSWFTAPAFPLWKQLAHYAGAKGIGLFLLELAGRGYREDRPDWKYLASDGKRGGADCYANAEYADWYTGQLDRAFATHPIRHFQWDEGWMDGVTGMIGEDARCYDPHHGHLPGNVSYQQFRNVERTLRVLREHHPQTVMVIISGLIRGMPWIMRDLDADSHTGAMENAAWMDHNLYFLPPSRGHRQGALHWILANRSSGEEPSGTGTWYQMLEDPKRREAYRAEWQHWTLWASRNRDLLEQQRDLFYAPGTGRLQGSAHCSGDHGYLFLHNPGDRAAVGEVAINHWLGLDKHERFRVRALYPETSMTEGVYGWADMLRFEIAPHGTLLFEITATDDPIRRSLPAPATNVAAEKAFLRLEDLTRVIDPGDLWQALGLPGRDKMPVF